MLIDNEASDDHSSILEMQGLTVQLLLPFNHRENLSGCATQAHKNHLIVEIIGTDPSFPMMLWDKLIPQASTTINLPRNSRINPKILD